MFWFTFIKQKNDPDKIKVAISIIDHLKMRLDEVSSSDKSILEADTIGKERMDNINQEYQAFVAQKLTMIRYVRDFQSKLCKMIEDVRLPSLEEHLSSRYATSSSKYTCQFCETFRAKNQRAPMKTIRYDVDKQSWLTYTFIQPKARREAPLLDHHTTYRWL